MNLKKTEAEKCILGVRAVLVAMERKIDLFYRFRGGIRREGIQQRGKRMYLEN